MQIQATGLGKKFIREWIFRGLDTVIEQGQPTAITGPNGSGKSTLLQILSGHHLPNEGKIAYTNEGQSIPVEKVYRYISIAAPYLEVIEELTLDELLDFHFKFKPLKDLSIPEFKELVYLENQGKKEVKKFSSGMKQRLKLGLCFFTDAKICFLDEPTSNLDEFGVNWYLDNINKVLKEKVIIVSSNQKLEYEFCEQVIHIPDYK